MTGAVAGTLAAWAIEALVASAALMAVVLVVRGPVRRAFGPQVAYALWALPALRLLLPPLPAAVTEQATMPINRATDLVLILPNDLPAAAAEPAAAIPWLTIGLVAWALGAAAFFGLNLLRHRRFCRRLLADARVLDEVDGIRIVESDAASGPLAFGTVRRFVAFPRDFAERYDADERALALLHELGHHRACDLWANWAALAVLALHWFNPLAWHAFRAFRCDQELANDARVLADRGRADRHVYACAILKAAHGGHVSAVPSGACHLHTIADLKGRLRMLTRARPSRRRLAAGATAVVGVVAAGLCLTASGTRAAAAVTERLSETVGIDIAQAAPAPPATPTPVGTPTVVKRVVVRRNGETRVMEGAEAEAFIAANPPPPAPLPPLPPRTTDLAATPPATLSADGKSWTVRTDRVDGSRFTMVTPPDVTSRACVDGPDGGPKQFVLQQDGKDRHVTIICRNRIDRAAREGARRGAEIAANPEFRASVARQAAEGAHASAFTSIRTARASILANRNLTADQRREALAGLAEAEAELREAAD